jgi:hypothetical protein
VENRPTIYGPDGREVNKKPACGFHQPLTVPKPKTNRDIDADLRKQEISHGE